MSSETLHLACEEAALSSTQSVPPIQILARADMLASSDGKTLYLSAGIGEMTPAQQQAYLGLCLHFHHQYATYLRNRLRLGSSLGERAVTALKRAGRWLQGSGDRDTGPTPQTPAGRDAHEDMAHLARQRSFSRFANGDVKLLQALLQVRAGYREGTQTMPGVALFADADQLGELARYLEMLLEGQYTDEADQPPWPAANKLLRLAHKTSLLIEPGSDSTDRQVAGLNRLYGSIGPVGSLAHVISRLMREPQSDGERVELLVELLTSVTPVSARLPLVDLAASRLLKLPAAQRLSLLALLREALGEHVLKGQHTQDEESPHILAWTLLSVLRGRIQPPEDSPRKPEPLADKDKRRCLATLMFVASEMAGEDESISARALRNQLDKVSEALDIDRPVSAPDVFQAAAWTETLEDLTRFSLHDSLSLIDALGEWGRDSARYQTWLDALCQKLHLHREDARPVKVRTVLSERSD